MTATATATAQPVRTRRTTISAKKLNNDGVGRPYAATWIGLLAVFTTFDGERLVGEITGFDRCNYPVVTFPDGKWARLDLKVEIVATDAA